MKLSVIICVYNTPKEYLDSCLESISRSTVKDLPGGYEICMVDDGSTVDYSDLIEKHRLRVTKTENRGILSARITGAKMASGDYTVYCDSDDTVSFNYYLPMVEKACEENADIVINDWATHTEKARYYPKNDDTISHNINLSGDDILLEFVRNEGRQHSYYVLWNKLYKTELLQKSTDSILRAGIDEKCSYSEDAAINFFAFRDAKKAINIHTGFYFYRIHPNQTVKAATGEKLRSQIDSMTKTFRIMRENIGDNTHRDLIISHIDEWEKLMARAHYSAAKGAGYSELFPYIMKSYKTDTLKISTAKDGSCYAAKILLGDNFEDVDSTLLAIWNGEKEYTYTKRHKDEYTERMLQYLNQKGKLAENAASPVAVPNFKIPLKKKIIHNKFVNKVGMLFFKKGSKSREFLKKFL